MFYDVFLTLCKQKGVSPTRAGTDCGISSRTVADWKDPNKKVRNSTKLKLAEYFGVDVSVFETGLNDEQNAAIAFDELNLLNIYRKLSDSDKQYLITQAELLLYMRTQQKGTENAVL